jgi:hypothetical protein
MLGVRPCGNGRLAIDGRFRIGFVLFGGMVALQSSAALDATKLAYLAGIILCLLGTAAAVWRARSSPEVRATALWLVASAALVLLLAVSFLVALANRTPVVSWVRDIAPYALFAAVPLFALDGQASASRKLLVGMLVVAGLLCGLSWAIEWLSRRQIMDLPFAGLVLPSGQLPGLLYLFAMGTALIGAGRSALWVLIAGVILGLFLITGTRSSLLLLIPPLVMALLAGKARARSSLRLLVSHGLVAAAVVLGFQLALALPAFVELGRTTLAPGGPDPTVTFPPVVLGDRIGKVPSVVGNPASDPSFKERVAQYEAAWALFVSSPIVGVGPGHSIDWVNVSGRARSGFTADTPLVMPAKFGLLGVFVFLGAALAYGATVRTALRRGRRSGIALTLVGYGVWSIVGLPLGFLIEDKGASLALMLLLALAFAEGVVGTSTDPRPSDAIDAAVFTQADERAPGDGRGAPNDSDEHGPILGRARASTPSSATLRS